MPTLRLLPFFRQSRWEASCRVGTLTSGEVMDWLEVDRGSRRAPKRWPLVRSASLPGLDAQRWPHEEEAFADVVSVQYGQRVRARSPFFGLRVTTGIWRLRQRSQIGAPPDGAAPVL